MDQGAHGIQISETLAVFGYDNVALVIGGSHRGVENLDEPCLFMFRSEKTVHWAGCFHPSYQADLAKREPVPYTVLIAEGSLMLYLFGARRTSGP